MTQQGLLPGDSPRVSTDGNFDILIVEDHPLLADSVATAVRAMFVPPIHCTLVTAPTLRQATVRLARSMPRLIITDLNLPDARGVATLEALLNLTMDVPIVVFSADSDADVQSEVLSRGAKAFISKSALPQDFREQVARFIEAAVHHNTRDCGPSRPRRHPDHPVQRLTRRQRDVLAEVAAGYSNREIAQRLNIGEETVRTHLSEAFQRLGVLNRTQASLQYMRWAADHGALA